MGGMDMKDMPASSQSAASMAGMKMDEAAPANSSMAGMAMDKGSSETTMPSMGGGLSFGLLAAMWIVMMIGMMLPSATPMIVMAARIGQARQQAGATPLAGAGAFALGYLLAWSAFAVVAAAVQVGLQQALLVGADSMALLNPLIGGAVLIVAGLYQWTPLKRLCLVKCRSPVGYLFGRWRPGTLNAVRIGAGHGLYCLGCCWILMAILFVAGVMALPWVAALAAFVLLEKLAPRGEWIARAGGIAMAGAGIYLIVAR